MKLQGRVNFEIRQSWVIRKQCDFLELLTSVDAKEHSSNFQMKIERKDLACVTNVEILSTSEIPHEIPSASNIEIKQDVETEDLQTKAEEALGKVPYILNGELYQILARKGENVTVKCCYCPIGRFYRGSVRSTGNFHMHIKRRHPYLLGRLHDMKVASLIERRDRLTKDRKIKRLRRQPFKITPKTEQDAQDIHEPKIKRAFQRHQAEANGSNYGTLSAETNSGTQSFGDFALKKEHPTQFMETLSNGSGIVIDGNVYYDVHVHNDNAEAKLTQNVKLSTSQLTTPTSTPYPSPYSGSAFGGYNSPPPAGHHVEIETVDVERPLDLSLNSVHCSTEESSAADSHLYDSGTGLGVMCSDTTVANTASTTISSVRSVADNNNTTSAMFHSFADPNWQRLSLTLHDIHKDMNARNRIEHNRLLLDIAKFKYLHPSFYFNLQE